ncbi:filamentous hemagglutinin N-terminal domain-containing protein [Moorena producens JHB]|uniref:Filamentous hemagglutinin N-terminal domain-containing protein n=1 Tax=Moorena producens (strain JHB) TaxID=1454205 RepID=A0A9Q9SU95_MOOP1|nr:filamentous hemagglutinin N-terminal domain-containing protein [Moorena producens]WAN69777.1 filamentous hemagglutinin N-terminal domain-containing protein [Moorena producens JHB]
MKPRIDRLLQASPFVLCSLLGATTALGQITPDNSLGNERSVVTPNVNVKGALADLIEGGAIRESNLFHSFQDFNVAEFGRVYFANPVGVANILSRVTGTNVSNILGTLGVLGNANLFVINPNGIFFGPNSRLDLGGSFFGSTADSVLFEDGTVFSAKNPNEKPLLTINIPSGLQYGSNPGSITNQSSLFQVPNGQTLGLIGGEVNIPGGHLTATDGRIELGSVSSNSVVNLTPTDSSFVLDYSAVNDFQDISLSNGAFVNTSGEAGGSIQLQGANVSLRDRSFVFASTLGSQNGGGIVVEASQLSLEGGSLITANVLGSGQGGDVSITTGELMVSDGAVVSTSTIGEGDGGNLTVDASSTVQLIGTSADGRRLSSLLALSSGIGKGGDISITTGELILSDGAVVSTSTIGEGDGGNLTVDASSTVQLIGISADGELRSSLFTDTFGTGKAGELKITTGQLIVSDGAEVSTDTIGEGDGGNLTVDASSTVQVIGTSADGRFTSGLFTQTSGGNGGDVSITTGQLIVKDGAVVSASIFGEGDGGNLTVNASESVRVIGVSANGTVSALGANVLQGATGNSGNINIQASSLVLDNGGRINASTFGKGNGGIINISVSDQVFLQSGDFSSGGGFSRILSNVGSGAEGNTGGINITTGSLVVENAGQIQSDVFGQGNSGKITIRAKDTVSFDGRRNNDMFPSAAFSRVQSGGIGNSGGIDIIIEQGSLFITNRAQLSAVTSGTGNSGNISIDAQDQVFLSNSIIISEISEGADQVTGDRKAGDITIKTGSLVLQDGSSLLADTEAQGNGGKITIEARDNVILEGIGPQARANPTNLVSSQITSTIDNFEQAVGNGGDINISTKLLSLTDGAFIRNDNFNQGNAGNIKITTENLSLTDSAFLSVRNRGQGNPGNLGIEADSILLDNKGIITAETVGGDQGNITLSSRDIRLLNESLIITDARNTTTGGNITIDTDTLVGLGNSDITANAEFGPGGSVTINAQAIFGLEFRDRLTPDNDITSTSTLGSSFNGDVILNISQIDPTSGLTELPASPVDAEAILANDLCGFENNRIAGGSSFFITGKGGLPASADDPVINTDRTVGWLSRPGLASNRQALSQQPNVTRPLEEKKVIIEAQGWVIAKDGTIILTAQPFRGTPVEQILPNLDCHSGVGSRE